MINQEMGNLSSSGSALRMKQTIATRLVVSQNISDYNELTACWR